MNRVRPEAPPFWDLAQCLSSKPLVPIVRRGNSLCAGYKGCSFYVERRGRVTPGGVKLLSKRAKRGIVRVIELKKAMLFLYGKDLFSGFEVVKPPCKDGFVLVYWRGRLLGLGKLSRYLLNVLDFGEFLRRGY